MSEVKHTPGPWHADLSENYTLGGDTVEITLHDEEGMVIDQIACVCLETGEDSPEDQKIYREQEANARLIAAAPELLASLKQILEILDSCLDIRDLPLSCRDAASEAEAVIAKAEGGQ